MDKYLINGGNKLNGSVTISGSKNAALPIITATIIEPGIYTLYNMPQLSDTRTMAKLIKIIGGKAYFENNVMYIDTTECNSPIAPYDLVKTMRASFYVLGPFMSRFGKATVSLPGGCAWGPRPVDYHLTALEQMGADVSLDSGNIEVKGLLRGSDIKFKQSSVGATGNIIMASVKAHGETIIREYAKEPEIEDLICFLRNMDASIDLFGTRDLKIIGKKTLAGGGEHTIIPDRIEAATFMIAVAICGGEVTINKINPDHLVAITNKLIEVGIDISVHHDSIDIKSSGSINPVDIITEPYPGFPTDIQAQWMAMMAFSNGNSKIIENIYKDRFSHISELSRFGSRIELNDNIATTYGRENLRPAPVMSTDIRASAALVLAALGIKGGSSVSRIYHLDRGYERFEQKMTQLGADIKRSNI